MLETLEKIWALRIFRVAGEDIHVGQFFLVILLLVAGYLASKLIEKLIERRMANSQVRPNAIYALKRVAFYLVIAIVAITALGLLNVPLTAFAFVSGAVAIGVGFGAQNVVNNFLSGWILLAEQPVRIGDVVELDEHIGTVEHIGNRSTRIRRVDGVHLLIPNSQLLERVVVNWTLIDREIRTKFSIGVAYGSPIERVRELIEQAVKEQPEVMQARDVVVVLEDFGDNAILFEAYFWCEVGGERELRMIRSAIRFRLAVLFEQAGIVIAFPQRDVHLDSTRPVQIELVGTGQSDASLR